MKRTYLALLLVANTASASPTMPVVTFLKAGESAPYQGYLFTESKELELRIIDKELNYYKALTASLGNINKLQDDNITKFDEKIKIRDEKIESLQKSNFWTILGGFTMGCLITTAIVFGVSNVK